jgi:NAD(P)-dependent dehydrogenase (short-subunit alcohol dehydrogenase family)/acyl carrier protein
MSVGQAHVAGVGVDLWAVFAGSGGQWVELPTYAFQRRRYWLESSAVSGDVGGLGSRSAEETQFWEAVEHQDLGSLTTSLGLDDPDITLRTALPALSSWRRALNVRTALDSWRYRVTWMPMKDKIAAKLSGVWLIVAPADTAASDLTNDCVAAIRAHGGEAKIVLVGDDDSHRERLGRILADLDRGVVGVISLIGIDTADFSATGAVRTLTLAQALADVGLLVPLWCLTQGAVSVAADDLLRRPSGALVWGLGRVVGLEHPRRWGGLVDLPEVMDSECWVSLCSLLGNAMGEDQFAIRSTGIFLRRLVHAPFFTATPTTHEWTPSGTILIAGGTGALGGHIARWLVQKYKSVHLLLLSRSGLNAGGAVELIDDLRTAGGHVTVEACDVTDRVAVAEVLERIPAERPLDAVFHVAGENQPSSLMTVEKDSFIAELASKLKGSQVLHDLTADRPLSAYVMSSSVSGVWGSSGQSAYSAANAYLDAFAEKLRALGTPATAIAWGPWAGAGMVDHHRASAVLNRIGLKPLSPVWAIEALSDALSRPAATLTVVDVNWERFYPTFASARTQPFLYEIPEVKKFLESSPVTSSPSMRLIKELRGLQASDQQSVMLKLVVDRLASVRGYPTTETMNPDQSFRDLGLDSLGAIELRNKLSSVTGLNIPATLIFDYPTATLLSQRVLSQMLSECPELFPRATSLTKGDNNTPAAQGGNEALFTIANIESIVRTKQIDGSTREKLRRRLYRLVRELDRQGAIEHNIEDYLVTATDEAVFKLIDDELE